MAALLQIGERLNSFEKSELSSMHFVPKIVFWMMFYVLVYMHLIRLDSCCIKSIECISLWDAKTKIIPSAGVHI